MERFPKVVSSENPCWNFVKTNELEVLRVGASREFTNALVDLYEPLNAHLLDHPWVNRNRAWNSVFHSGYRVSDHQSISKFKENPLYREVYRHLAADHQIAAGVYRGADESVVVTINRCGRDFDDAEFQSLELLGRGLQQVLARLYAREALEEQLSSLAEVASAGNPSIDWGAFTNQELQTLRRLLQWTGGHRSLAASLGISHYTLAERLRAMCDKVGVESTRQLRAALLERPRVS